jgi:hypothetical protein
MKPKIRKILFLIIIGFILCQITPINYKIFERIDSTKIKHENLNDPSGKSLKSAYQFKWDSLGVPICTAENSQWLSATCSDGAGGTIIAWEDDRFSIDSDIYVQKINISGIVQWSPNGTVICNASDYQSIYGIISDGAGGAIIVWEDHREGYLNADIYAQRIDTDGNIRWTPNGTVICNASNVQYGPDICSDGAGGAIITWKDERFGDVNCDIYAQRIDINGNIKWISNGTVICNASNNQFGPTLCSDGDGGAIITWTDERFGEDDRAIYAQRINSEGVTQWISNGTVISDEINDQEFPEICSDGAGGAIIVWEDYRSGSSLDIYAQKINFTGQVNWTDNGITICNELHRQQFPSICNDSSGGAIISWLDDRFPPYTTIYVQKVGPNGEIKWTINGLSVSEEFPSLSSYSICSDGLEGALITFVLSMNYYPYNLKIYAQRIDINGNLKWTSKGIPICIATGIYSDQHGSIICSSGDDGFIIAWLEKRTDSFGSYDIYAQRITTEGDFIEVSGGGGGGGGGGGKKKEGEAIPGYEISFTIALMALISIILLKNMKKKQIK